MTGSILEGLDKVLKKDKGKVFPKADGGIFSNKTTKAFSGKLETFGDD